MCIIYPTIFHFTIYPWRCYILTVSWKWSCVMAETGRSRIYLAYCNKWEINSPVRLSRFAFLSVYRFNLPPCFRKWDMFIKGKTALVTGAATGIGLEYVKALLKNGAQVSYIGWLHSLIRAIVETRLHSHDTLRGSVCFVDRQSWYLLRKYIYQRLEFVTTVVHGSTLHVSTIIANCCNGSNTHFLPSHFILRYKQNGNKFKKVSVKCELD